MFLFHFVLFCCPCALRTPVQISSFAVFLSPQLRFDRLLVILFGARDCCKLKPIQVITGTEFLMDLLVSQSTGVLGFSVSVSC
jgi:hypothetical protein